MLLECSTANITMADGVVVFHRAFQYVAACCCEPVRRYCNSVALLCLGVLLQSGAVLFCLPKKCCGPDAICLCGMEKGGASCRCDESGKRREAEQRDGNQAVRKWSGWYGGWCGRARQATSPVFMGR